MVAVKEYLNISEYHTPTSRGFTLLELLVVVIILGILAAIVFPLFVDHTEQVEKASFIYSIKALAGTIELYHAANLEYPADVSRATRPRGMERYFSTSDWTEETPISGVWDWDANVFSIKAGISVVESEKDAEYIRDIDALLDNGNLGTGKFRAASSDRYTYVLSE